MHLLEPMLKRRIVEIEAAALRARKSLEPVWTCVAPGDPADAAMAPPPGQDAEWRLLRRGERWGVAAGADPAFDPPRLPWQIPASGGSTHWLRVPFALPADWHGGEVLLELLWEGTGLDQVESIVYLDGLAIAGLDWGHRRVLLPAHLHSGEWLIRAAVAFPRPFAGVELQLRDAQVFRLGRSMQTLFDTALQLHAEAPLRYELLGLLERAYGLLDLRSGYAGQAFADSAGQALQLLEAWLQAQQSEHAEAQTPQLLANGHGHLDVAWLWPLWRTRQKVAHTVASTLELMQRYPDYHFSMSQPHVYQFLKHDDPQLYAQLRQRVLEGRFEPVGMMWVEPDCNVPSGESLIRQMLYGAQFFASEFPERYGLHGQTPHLVWLPDAFGFTAALPQIMRGCGVRCFMSSKLSWNQSNRFPYETFRWRGIDGSEVLAHFLTTSVQPLRHPSEPQPFTYGGVFGAPEAFGAWRHYRQPELNQQLLYLYGHADGGGGPDESMLESARVLTRLAGVPQVRLGRVQQYFDELYQRVWDDPRLPSWSGELYLEYHRGTFTSQAWIKQANRAAELLYREAEWLNAWAASLGEANRQPELDTGWQLILLNQFHDILPGTSIAAVYADARADHAQIRRIGAAVRDTALAALRAELSGTALLLNTLPWQRQETVRIALNPGEDPAMHELAALLPVAQLVEEHPGERGLLLEAQAPAYGFATLHAPAVVHSAGLLVERERLQNDALRLEFDAHGCIRSLYDRQAGRELVLPGQQLNQLLLYEDRPLEWDAWDIDPFYTQKAYPLHDLQRWEVVEQGPLRVAVELTRRFGNSSLRQRICLWRHSQRIDFVTAVDWQERQTLLRAVFPLNLNAAHASCEIQFGALERPTHRNTSWEQARFEVCAQRWVDLSEGDYGVALLNDGKYGHSFTHSTLGLSLLRGAVFPDPDADRGLHRFTYSLLPHQGDWRSAQVPRRAYELNAPLQVLRGELASSPQQRSLLQTSNEHIIVETVKCAADGDGLIIRLYEAQNRRGSAELIFERPVRSAEETDMLERGGAALRVDGRRVQFEVRPFEIKTLRVRM